MQKSPALERYKNDATTPWVSLKEAIHAQPFSEQRVFCFPTSHYHTDSFCSYAYRMKARAPAPIAMMLAPTWTAPPVAAAEALALEAEEAMVAEAETSAAAAPEAEPPVLARRVAQRDLARL